MPDFILAKIGRRAYMEPLIREGLVYMQPLGYYCDLESRVVGDPNEGLLLRFSGENPSLRVAMSVEGGPTIPVEGLRSMTVTSPVRENAVYCMTGVRSSRPGIDPSTGPVVALDETQNAVTVTVNFDARMADFGDSMVLFHNSPEFVRRLSTAARIAGYEIDHAPTEYVATDHCGGWGAFRKLTEYQYQREIRFITTAPVDAPIVLRLGSLEDIAWLIDMRTHSTR